MRTIASVIGARPQFIKFAPLARALAEYNISGADPVRHVVIHSGQHYDYRMSEIFFRELGIPDPDHHLNAGSGLHGAQTGLILERSEAVFIEEKPDAVLVFGDINTALAAALAAVKLHIPVAHAEAGLRSFNRRMPEEINRVLIDHMSQLLFCPSEKATANLAAEGFAQIMNHGRYIGAAPVIPGTPCNFRRDAFVFHSGDLMYDALLYSLDLARSRSAILSRLGLIPGQYRLLTLHRSENTEDPVKTAELLDFVHQTSPNRRVIFPIHPRTARFLREAGTVPASRIEMTEPAGYFDMLMLLKHSEMLFTDSGGMQKEAFWLNIPCITLREETEWRETVESGWNVLYRHYRGSHEVSPGSGVNPGVYGDGRAAECMVRLLTGVRFE